jgi:putative photosynthetic complex assembly protein 2
MVNAMAILVDYAMPVLCALLVWWFGTGLVLYIVRLPRSLSRWSGWGAAAIAVLALAGMAHAARDSTVAGVYGGFVWAVALWGAIEIWFLLGQVTGPRREPCPAGARGLRRATFAVLAILYHELALLASLLIIAAATVGGENQAGLWTFALLWIMRLSAKLNLFFGVPILHEGFLPEQLRYLSSYFRKGPINPLFPVSVTLSTVAAVLLVSNAVAAGTSPTDAVAGLLLATLLALAVVEHWFMAVPLPVEAIWSWSMKPGTSPASAAEAPIPELARRRPELARQNLEDRFRQALANQTTTIEVTPVRRSVTGSTGIGGRP